MFFPIKNQNDAMHTFSLCAPAWNTTSYENFLIKHRNSLTICECSRDVVKLVTKQQMAVQNNVKKKKNNFWLHG